MVAGCRRNQLSYRQRRDFWIGWRNRMWKIGYSPLHLEINPAAPWFDYRRGDPVQKPIDLEDDRKITSIDPWE